MSLKGTIRTTALAATLATGASTAMAEKAFLILDILPLYDGKTIEDANGYFADIEPILAKHGMVRSDHVLEVVSILRGPVSGQVVNLWESENPQASFDGIFADDAYLAHTENRDSIFDLKNATIIITQRDGS